MSESDLTIWCGNLSNRVTEELLYELFLQAGPLQKVVLPKDPAGYNRSYAFITFKHECSLPYASALFSQTKLFDRPLLIKQTNRSRQEQGFETNRSRQEQGFETNRSRQEQSFASTEKRPQIDKRNYNEERRPSKEPTSWAELNALKGPKENRQYKDVPPNGLGLALEPDFNMLLQMGNQMMFPPSLPMQVMSFPPYFGGPTGYPSQTEDMFGSRPREHQSHGHGHNRPNHHPYEHERDHYRDHSNKETDRRDHGRSAHRYRDSSSSHHNRERRDRRH